jgi:antitoxin MazE
MLGKVQKWGNSQGIRLSKEVLAEANILVGDELEITSTKDKLVIKPIRKIRGKYHLQVLVAKIPQDYKANEENWGSAVGLEVML